MSDHLQMDNLPNPVQQFPPVVPSGVEEDPFFAEFLITLDSNPVPEHQPVEVGSENSIRGKESIDFLASVANPEKDSYDRRFMKGSHNSVKLESSLAEMGNQGLLEHTLLRAEVAQKHAAELLERFLRKAKKIDKREDYKKAKNLNRAGKPYRRGEKRIKLFSTYQSFRFLTILHRVVNLCPLAAVNEVKKMKHQLNEIFTKVLDVSCLGSFEIEVTCRKKMREICDRTLEVRKKALPIPDGMEPCRVIHVDKCNESEEFRKLHVLESMGAYLENSLYSEEPSELLIHCHLVVCARSDEKFDELLKILGKNPNWNKEPRQILMKSLTKKYGKKIKSVEDNLRDIADYITKGGNDWIGKKAYLRYKIKFSSGTAMSEEEIISQNWRSNEMLRQHRTDQGGIKDLLSLSVLEINVLVESINGMMNLAPNGKGYLYAHGRW